MEDLKRIKAMEDLRKMNLLDPMRAFEFQTIWKGCKCIRY
jgi:hypothetical protein